jgi:hypothetical protein
VVFAEPSDTLLGHDANHNATQGRCPAALRALLLGVGGGVTYILAVQQATAQHYGRSIDVTACQLMRVETNALSRFAGTTQTSPL